VRAEGLFDTPVRNESEARLSVGPAAKLLRGPQQHPTRTREGVGGECAR